MDDMDDTHEAVHQQAARSVLRSACCASVVRDGVLLVVHRSVLKHDVVMHEGARNALAMIVYRKCS